MFDKEQFPSIHRWIWWKITSKHQEKECKRNPIRLNNNGSNTLLHARESTRKSHKEHQAQKRKPTVYWNQRTELSSLSSRPLGTLQIMCVAQKCPQVKCVDWNPPSSQMPTPCIRVACPGGRGLCLPTQETQFNNCSVHTGGSLAEKTCCKRKWSYPIQDEMEDQIISILCGFVK